MRQRLFARRPVSQQMQFGRQQQVFHRQPRAALMGLPGIIDLFVAADAPETAVFLNQPESTVDFMFYNLFLAVSQLDQIAKQKRFATQHFEAGALDQGEYLAVDVLSDIGPGQAPFRKAQNGVILRPGLVRPELFQPALVYFAPQQQFLACNDALIIFSQPFVLLHRPKPHFRVFFFQQPCQNRMVHPSPPFRSIFPTTLLSTAV